MWSDQSSFSQFPQTSSFSPHSLNFLSSLSSFSHKETKDTIFQDDSKMFVMEGKDKLCKSDKVGYHPQCSLGFIVRKAWREPLRLAAIVWGLSTITKFPIMLIAYLLSLIYTYNPQPSLIKQRTFQLLKTQGCNTFWGTFESKIGILDVYQSTE